MLWMLLVVTDASVVKVCLTIAHPEDATQTIPSCTISTDADVAAVTGRTDTAIELHFERRHSVDFTSLQLHLPSVRLLVLHMTHLSGTELRQTLSAITAPMLNTLTVHRDLEVDGDAFYLEAATFEHIGGTVRTLNLADIGIGTLHEESLHGLNSVGVLDLSHNYLDAMPENALVDCANLTILRLQNNFIVPDTLLRDAFAGPNELHWLNLENNDLTELPALRFQRLTTLSILVLGSNNLRNIDRRAFAGLSALHYLSLSNNKLLTVPTEALAAMPALYSLDLSFNELDALPADVFRPLTELEILYLQYTNLAELRGDSFRGLGKLHELHLKGNQLSMVSSDMLLPLAELIMLDVSDNRVRHVEADAFATLSDLRVLNMENNKLQLLEEGVFEGVELQEVYMSDNLWNCSCRLLWLFEWLQEHESVLSNEREQLAIQCSSPPEWNHYTFYDLRSGYVMNCWADMTTEGQQQQQQQAGMSGPQIGGLVAGLLILVIIVVSIAIAVAYTRHKKYRFWTPQKPEYNPQQRQRERQQTPSWCKEPSTPVITPTPATNGAAASDINMDETLDNKANEAFAFDNLALDTTKNSQSPTRSNGNISSDYTHYSDSAQERAQELADDNLVHVDVDFNKNKPSMYSQQYMQ